MFGACVVFGSVNVLGKGEWIGIDKDDDVDGD